MTINVTVRRKDGESTEQLVDRFLKKVSKSRVLAEAAEHRFFVSRRERRRLDRRNNKRK